jgi:hypothetical protein
MKLVGVRHNQHFRSPFYCVSCLKAVSREKRWYNKSGIGRRGVSPLIKFDSGVVRYLRVPMTSTGDKSGDRPIEDPDFGFAQESRLRIVLDDLGCRIIPSLPLPAELDLSCKVCKVNPLTAEGFAL